MKRMIWVVVIAVVLIATGSSVLPSLAGIIGGIFITFLTLTTVAVGSFLVWKYRTQLGGVLPTAKNTKDNWGYIASGAIVLGGMAVIHFGGGWKTAIFVGGIAMLAYAFYRWTQEPARSSTAIFALVIPLLILTQTPWGLRQLQWVGHLVGVRTDAEVVVAEAEARVEEARVKATLARVPVYDVDGNRVLPPGFTLNQEKEQGDGYQMVVKPSGPFFARPLEGFCVSVLPRGVLDPKLDALARALIKAKPGDTIVLTWLAEENC